VRVVGAASQMRVPLRLLGGVAVRLHVAEMPQAVQREYKDLDFATSKRGSGDVQKLLRDLGYEPHVAFNAMNSKERLLFYDNGNQRQVDVFVSAFRMCHEIPLEGRLEVHDKSVPLAELLLTKLQIIELNEKDVRDAVALFHGHDLSADDTGINTDRVAQLCADDWGLWRTITANLATVRGHIDRYELESRDRIRDRVDRLLERIEAEPKSRGWRMRARIGERKRWYELPEEV
jgi:hypothetical protein